MDKPKEDVIVEDKAKENGKGDKPEPKEGSPRWNEVYRKMKDAEREKEEMKKDLDALRRHSREMADSLEKINKQKADRPEIPAPNPSEDPEGYVAWHKHQMAEKEKDWEARRQQDRMDNMRMFMEEMYPDYQEMASVAEKDIENDPRLKDEIYNSPNPFKKAYQYGKKKKSESAPASPVDVEPSGDVPPSGKEDPQELSDVEMRVAKNLWPGMPVDKIKETYLKHKQAMGGER